MLMCLGSPIVDIIVNNVPREFLAKYDLKPDEQHRTTPFHKILFEEILKMNPKFLAGGSVTNTVRIFQSLTNCPKNVIYVGSIGTDDFGKIVQNKLDEEAVLTHFIERKDKFTGQCAVLISEDGKCRCLVSDLRTSNFFDMNDLDSKEMRSIIYKSHCLYISAFFLRVSTDVTKSIISRFKEDNKRVVINLGAVFLCEGFPEEVTFMVENSDVVIGNQAEFYSLFIKTKIDEKDASQFELNQKLCFLSTNCDKIFIKTNSTEPVVAYKNGEMYEYPVGQLENVIDTNGAGDAFVGGFLAKYLENKNLDDSIRCGIRCARVIVQCIGCDFSARDLTNLDNFSM